MIIQGLEINLEVAFRMKKPEFVKTIDRLGKDGSTMWEEVQKHKKKSDKD